MALLFSILMLSVLAASQGVPPRKDAFENEVLRTYVTTIATAPNPGFMEINCQSADDQYPITASNGNTVQRSFDFTGFAWTHFWCTGRMITADFTAFKIFTKIFQEGGPNHGGTWVFNTTGGGLLKDGWTYRSTWVRE